MKRSKFSLSYTHLTSFDMGELIPCGMLEVLPGDSIRMNTSALVRCAPMLAPPMHPVHVCIHHWFVPYRILWDNWENFITGGPDGLNASVFPTFSKAVAAGSLLNYLGAPVNAAAVTMSVLPVRAYNLIWNEWYRDQDLQTALAISKGDGNDATTAFSLQNCCWEKDYFTTARPWEQKGAAVTIPLTGTGDVTLVPTGTNSNAMLLRRAATDALSGVASPLNANASSQLNESTNPLVLDPNGRLTTSLTAAGITVNALRDNLAIQRYQEAAARYGSRYAEYLARLGVRYSDGRLSRPEYLGGGRQTLQFSEVLQTAADGTNPVSTLRGHGISALRSNAFTRFIEEHGLVMSLAYVKPKTIYTDGLGKVWNRRTKFDFWQPELQNLGQQKVLNKELRSAHATPDGTFGYQDRFDEYRRAESRVSAEFATSTQNYWHFGRSFASDPALNATFVSAVPTDRPFAVPANDVILANFRHSIKARRLVSRTAHPRTF